MANQLAIQTTAPTPQAVTGDLLSQASRLGVGLRVQTKTIFPAKGPSYEVVTGCDIGGSVSQLPAVRRMLEIAMAPAHRHDIEAWIAELSVLVIPRNQSEFDAELTLSAYATRLNRYPKDVVHYALLVKSWKFFPSWDELQEVCNRLVAKRTAMWDAVNRPAPEASPAPQERKPLTDEARNRILAENGFTPERFRGVKARPMATKAGDLPKGEARDDEPRQPSPGWTDGLPADGPEMQQLRKSRDNPLAQAAREDLRAAEARSRQKAVRAPADEDPFAETTDAA